MQSCEAEIYSRAKKPGLSPRLETIHGFTLIEMLVVLAVIGIILSMAVPSMRNFLRRQQLSSQSQEFFTAVNLARTEAIRRGNRVTICRSGNGATCAASGNWDQGWMVFSDADNDAVVDVGEEIILVHSALNAGSSMIGNVNVAARITFNNLGNPGQAGTITLCNPLRGIDIIMSPPGRLRTAEGAACP